MKDKRAQLSILLSAAFLMATSAIGPGFLTQTATFTEELKSDFGFVILISLLLAIGVQLNVWRIICVSGMRGQDIANRILPGLGYFVAYLITIGGLAFNIGNVGGAALGLNSMVGLNINAGYFVCGLLSIVIFISKNAQGIVDRLMQILGALMILVIIVIAIKTHPPIGEAVIHTFVPLSSFATLFFPILTLLGGTVGGYITFAGAHRLVDAKITGKENFAQINKSSIMGIGIASLMRVFLFLAILGVVAAGNHLDPANPAASAFHYAAGSLGEHFFGFILFAAGITSIIGAAYTSVSFLKTLYKGILKYERYCIIGFIALSTIFMRVIGEPAKLLVLVGFLNGLILPITLTIVVIASRRKDIVGNYKHPIWLTILGILIVIFTLFLSIEGLPTLIADMMNIAG